MIERQVISSHLCTGGSSKLHSISCTRNVASESISPLLAKRQGHGQVELHKLIGSQLDIVEPGEVSE